MSDFPRLTGRTRHRNARYGWRKKRECLILQVEVKGWIYGDTPSDIQIGTWWRDATTKDVTVYPQ